MVKESLLGFSRPLCLTFAALVSITGIVVSPMRASAVPRSVSGTVYRDYDASGFRAWTEDWRTQSAADTQAIEEPGVAGIEILAFVADPAADASDTPITRTVTDAVGNYSLDIDTGAWGDSVRLEMRIPEALSYLEPVAVVNDGQLPTRVLNNATSLRWDLVRDTTFITLPHSGRVNFRVANPNDYCQQKPLLVTTCFRYGDQRPTRSRPTIFAWPQDRTGGAAMSSYVLPDALATDSQTGTTFGLGYNRHNDVLFASAYMRRFAGFGQPGLPRFGGGSGSGAGGPGAIYAIQNPGSADPKVSEFVNLNTLITTPTGADPIAGADPHPSAIGSGMSGKVTAQGVPGSALEQWYHDAGSWNAVGKLSFGDLEVSEDSQWLYVVNMTNGFLYKMSAILPAARASDIIQASTPVPCPPDDGNNGGGNDSDGTDPTNPGSGKKTGAPNTDCNDAGSPGAASKVAVDCLPQDFRPMAVALHDGKGYLGVVCSAETTQDRAQLRAYVFTFDTTTLAFNPVPIADVDLTYRRACPTTQATTLGRSHPYCADEQWMPWTSKTPIIPRAEANRVPGNTANTAQFYGTNWGGFPLRSESSEYIFAEPILATIAFDNNDMVLGIRNRFGDRVGPSLGAVELAQPVGASPSSQYSVRDIAITQADSGRGAIIRLCKDSAGSFQLEGGRNTLVWENGSQVTRFRSVCGTKIANNSGTTFGIGGTMFHGAYAEKAMGSLAIRQGSRDVVTTFVDPIGGEAAGTVTFANRTGHMWGDVGVYAAYTDTEHSGNSPATNEGLFAKSNGLGDLEFICAQAPVEVGDRVWDDKNGDGLQSANVSKSDQPNYEPGLADVKIELLDTAGTVVATTETDANGQFLFSSGEGRHARLTNTSFVYDVSALRGATAGLRLKAQLPGVSGAVAPAGGPGDGLLSIYELYKPTQIVSSAGTSQRRSVVYANGVSGPFTADTNRTDLDIGFSEVGVPTLEPVVIEIRGVYWNDSPSTPAAPGGTDGVREASDLPLAGARVELLRADGTPALTTIGVPRITVTAANGWYRFTDLDPGDYIIRFTRVTGRWAPTAVGADRAVDSDAVWVANVDTTALATATLSAATTTALAATPWIRLHSGPDAAVKDDPKDLPPT